MLMRFAACVTALLLPLFVMAGASWAQPASLPGATAVESPDQAQERASQQAAMGDLFGGRSIPPNILKIMADPRIEPVIAYFVWQAARKPIEEWTVEQFQEITAMIPTLPETGMPIAEIQALYEFLGLDPSDIFNPQLGNDWQNVSTGFDRSSAAAVSAISSADCQAKPAEMTIATLRSCQSGLE
jgi:hypothetical protein